MKKPKCSQKMPYVIDCEKKKYAWCSCGLSTKQPFCDGSHKNSQFSPIIIANDKYGKIAWCGCKRTCNPPYCDGAHSKL